MPRSLRLFRRTLSIWPTASVKGKDEKKAPDQAGTRQEVSERNKSRCDVERRDDASRSTECGMDIQCRGLR